MKCELVKHAIELMKHIYLNNVSFVKFGIYIYIYIVAMSENSIEVGEFKDVSLFRYRLARDLTIRGFCFDN